MLTPVEIQSKSFKSGGLGYDKKDVDHFMQEVLKNYEELYRENMELSDKLSVMNDAIQNYKAMEKTLQKALILAEKTAEETKSAAQAEAKRMEAEAKAKANLIISDAKHDLDQLHNQTVALIQQYERYRTQFKSMAAAQVDLLNSEAFSINVANLDVFIDSAANEQLSDTKSQKPTVTASGNAITDKNEIAKDTETVKAAPTAEEVYENYDLSDFEIEGQEEFEIIGFADDDE